MKPSEIKNRIKKLKEELTAAEEKEILKAGEAVKKWWDQGGKNDDLHTLKEALGSLWGGR